MAKVAVLADALINKIAAGEVVERPASVVKELVENALDAGARSIRVGLSGGGLSLVAVTDDGAGMSRQDAVLAMTRHATSKLRDLEGLFTIQTMGFRGEALPAIASVSRFSLVTSTQGAQVGTRITAEGGGELAVEDAAPVGGTRIRVEDLFFNTPARRKFMRGAPTELKHCEEAVTRVALAHPETAFHIEHDGRPLLSSPACPDDLRERIAAVLGPEVHRHLLPVEERRLDVLVRGFIAAPEYNLSSARGVYLFVNGRYVRDRALNAALGRAFGEVLPAGRQPVVVLHLELDPRAVDVNVHPQKIEVRFQDGRGVADALFHGVGSALRRSHAEATLANAGAPGDAAHYALAVDRFLARARGEADPHGGAALAAGDASPFAQLQPPRAPAFGEARPGINEAPPPGFFTRLRFLALHARRYWLCEGEGGTLVVLDPHAAWERAALEASVEQLRLRRRQGGDPGSSSGLFSATVELAAPEARLLREALPALGALGLEVEPFGKDAFVVRAMPPGAEGLEARTLLTELAPAVPPGPGPHDEAALLPALRVLACAAGRRGSIEPRAEAQVALFAQLDAAKWTSVPRHPRVVLKEVPLLELDQRARGLERQDG
jgi:DNA mismatch repair protein MutL